MATIVNGPDGDRGAGGWIIAIVVIIILILLALFLFPSLFGDDDTTNNVEVGVPATTGTNPGANGSAPSVINNTFNSTTTIDATTTPQ